MSNVSSANIGSKHQKVDLNDISAPCTVSKSMRILSVILVGMGIIIIVGLIVYTFIMHIIFIVTT